MDRCRIMARMLLSPDAYAAGSALLAGDPVAHYGLLDSLNDLGKDHAMQLPVGQCYHIQTVTHYWVGEIQKCDMEEIVLVKASCVYSVGPLEDAFQRGNLRRYESYPPEDDCHISQGAIVAANPWRHPLPGQS